MAYSLDRQPEVVKVLPVEVLCRIVRLQAPQQFGVEIEPQVNVLLALLLAYQQLFR